MKTDLIQKRLQKYAKHILFSLIYLAFAFPVQGQDEKTQTYSDLGEGYSANDTLASGYTPFVFDSLSYQIVALSGTEADAVLVWVNGTTLHLKGSDNVTITDFSIKNVAGDLFSAKSIQLTSFGATFNVQGYKAGALTQQIAPFISDGVLDLDFTNVDEIRFVGSDLEAHIDNFTYTMGDTNAAPTLTLNTSSLSYTENDPATQIDKDAYVNDSDGDSDWDGGSLKAQITVNAEDADAINISDTDGDLVKITVSGTNVLADGTDIGDLNISGGAVTGGDSLKFTFDSDATNINVMEVLQSLRYHNTSDNPGTQDRSFTITVTDNDTVSATQTRLINVVSVNDEPELSVNENLELDEGATGSISSSLLRADDLDDSGTGLSFTVTTLPSNGSLFVDNNDNGIADDVTETIDLNESFTQDDIDNGLLKFAHDDSETSSDSFVFSLADGGEDGVAPLDDQLFSIDVTEINDNDPVIAPDQTFSVDENAENSTVVGTVSASDADVDPVFSNWTITGGDPDGIFAIGSSNGQLSIADNTNLDFETITSYTLQLSVSDGSNTSNTESIEINVSDMNDNKPVITPSQEYVRDENLNEGHVLGTPEASDADDGSSFSDWKIVSGNPNNAFTINAGSGQISVNNSQAIDREAVEKFSLQISVSDGELVSDPEVVIVYLNDLNDNRPVIKADQSLSIDENSNAGALIGVISVTDADVTPTSFQNWTISNLVDLNGNGNNALAINPDSGELSVNDPLDFDCETTLSFTIKVKVSDGTDFGDEEEVIIDINDVNEYPPSIIPSQSFSVDEEARYIGVVEVEDLDAKSELHDLSIISGDINNVFKLHSETGEISVADNSTLDYETTTEYELSLTVNDGYTTSEAETVKISVSNVNEKPIADAGKSQFADELTRVQLDGSKSSDPEGEELEYRWTAPAGIQLSDMYGAQPDFVAPDVNETKDYEFSLIVNDGVLDSEPDKLIITVGLVTGITDVDTSGENVILYPNPSNGAFTLDLDQLPIDGALVSLTDLKAKVIYSQKIYEKKTIFNLSLSSGMYILKIEQAGKTFTKKLIIQ